MKLTAEDVMSREVIVVRPETPVEEAARQMTRHRITGMPVLDDGGSVVGMVSDFDVIGKKGRTVQEIMTTQVISVSPNTDMDEIGRILTSQHIRRLPVVHAGTLVGIVTRGDVIKRIIQRWICGVCGASEHGKEPPDHCSSCGADASAFTLVDEPPMMYRDM